MRLSDMPAAWQAEIAAGTEFGRRAAKLICATRRKSVSLPVAVSTLGTTLRRLIEAEIGRSLSCGDCLGYLHRLNHQTDHDAADIQQHLYANFSWPVDWRAAHATPLARRQRITQIVATAIESTGPS